MTVKTPYSISFQRKNDFCRNLSTDLKRNVDYTVRCYSQMLKQVPEKCLILSVVPKIAENFHKVKTMPHTLFYFATF